MDLPARTRTYQTAIYDSTRWDHFRLRPGDILVCTPAKCGTTWTQMLCAMLVHQSTVFPKPLVPIADKPVIEILLRRLAAHRFRTVTLCTGYLAELILAVCGNGSQYGLSIDYVREETYLGTAGPLTRLQNPTDPLCHVD